MTVRPIRQFGDPVLRTPADPVTVFDDELRSVVRDLLDTVASDGRAGVAGPQIGVGLRLFSYDVEDMTGYVINPVIELGEGEQDGEEGCLSVPGIWKPTVRAMNATVRGVDVDNHPVTVQGSGLLARCLQHEVDHLDGMLFLSRLSGEARRDAMRQLR